MRIVFQTYEACCCKSRVCCRVCPVNLVEAFAPRYECICIETIDACLRTTVVLVTCILLHTMILSFLFAIQVWLLLTGHCNSRLVRMRRLKDLEGALQPLQRFSQANPELEQVSRLQGLTDRRRQNVSSISGGI